MVIQWGVQLVLLVLALQAAVSYAKLVKPAPEERPTRLLVKYKQGKEPVPGRKGSKKLRGPRLYREDRRSNETINEALRRFKNDPNVEVVEPDYIVHALANVNDPGFGQQWALAANHMNAQAAWDITTGSKNVRVCVIDSGIQRTHQDLTANVVAGYDAITNTAGNTVDGNGHGTHCSGVIGATTNNGIGMAGLNHQVTIIPCKFLSTTGSGSTSDAIECIDWCSTTGGAKILSNSWGGGGSSNLLIAAINRAVGRGSLFVVAAGNNAANNDVATSNYPAKYNLPGMIAVAATTSAKTLASFSAYGATTVHIGAPGQSIYSSVISGGYELWDGTSMATPQVSGVAAMIWAINPNLTVAEVRTIILSNVDPGLSGKVSSGGILNAYKAVKAASLTIAPASPPPPSPLIASPPPPSPVASPPPPRLSSPPPPTSPSPPPPSPIASSPPPSPVASPPPPTSPSPPPPSPIISPPPPSPIVLPPPPTSPSPPPPTSLSPPPSPVISPPPPSLPSSPPPSSPIASPPPPTESTPSPPPPTESPPPPSPQSSPPPPALSSPPPPPPPAAVCKVQFTAVIADNTRYIGGTNFLTYANVATKESCGTRCEGNVRCWAFNYNKSLRRCLFFSEFGFDLRLTANTGFASGYICM